jgi:hypothetical protein
MHWIDLPSGGAEPEHPAPSLTLAKAITPAGETDREEGVGTVLGAAGLVAGLLALAIAIVALRRSGPYARDPDPPSSGGATSKTVLVRPLTPVA